MPAHNTKQAVRGKKKRLLDILFEDNSLSVVEICRKAGISTVTYYKYMQLPAMQEAIKDITTRTFTNRLPFTVNAITREAEKGNLQACKLVLEALQYIGKGNNQSVNVAVHKDTEPPTLQIDTPEQLEQAIAQCMAELATLQELIANLKAMRQPAGRLKGDGIHPQPGESGTEEA